MQLEWTVQARIRTRALRRTPVQRPVSSSRAIRMLNLVEVGSAALLAPDQSLGEEDQVSLVH